MTNETIRITAASDVTSLVVMNNTLYFAANDGTNSNELWKSDGTSTGTVNVIDLNPGVGTGVAAILN